MLTIREATMNDANEKGRVHYQSWKETYTGLISEDYMNQIQAESFIRIANQYPDNTFVAEIEQKIVGFASYGQCRSAGMESYGEIIAIYVLNDYQHQGIGIKLMEACIERLKCYDNLCLWVLNQNKKAIGFYQKLGFQLNGDVKQETLGAPVIELRMVRNLV